MTSVPPPRSGAATDSPPGRVVGTGKPSLRAILSAAGDPANRSQPVTIEQIDRSRPFVPEEYTHLFYTSIYGSLSDQQRLRYNQLFGVRINEFIMMLERDVLERVLLPLRSHRAVASNPELRACLDTMIEDERRHYAGFADLNRRCLPEVFVDGRDRYFTELSAPQRMLFWMLGRIARTLAFPLYSLMALEESSMAMARRMIHDPASPTLGALEPHFVAVHREHMKDEARHVQIQAHLIDACLTRAGKVSRWSYSRLFKTMLSGLTTVGRSGSGARVLRHLVREHPELAPREPEMVDAIAGLGDDPAYQRSLFNRTVMPRAFAVFDRTPEFDDLPTYMVGYDRQ